MEIKLYLEDRELILTDRLQGKTPLYLYDYTEIPLLVSKIKKEDIPRIYLYHPRPAEALEDVKKYFDVIEGAGGVVMNEKDEVLFIFRRNTWDLPKGKMEQGEEAAQTALREVREECGINNLEIERFITDTYHIFREGGRRKMKVTHWFLMKARSSETLEPQTIEGIEKVEWISKEKFEEKTGDLRVYKSIKDLLASVKFFD